MTHRRSPAEIAEELKRFEQQPDGERDRLSLLHELQVYQEELTVHNEELIRARAALEESRDRFIELYDFAPNGYLTLDANGIILRINLTGAALLGRRRDVLEGMPLLGFATPGHRPRLLEFLRRCRTFDQGREVVVELSLRTADGIRDIQLICNPRRSQSDGAQQSFTAMLDITERRLLEAEREAAAREHAALAGRLISVQDDERQRIARDLHDNVGQQVTALRLLLDLAERSPDAEDQHRRIAQAQTIVDQLDRELDFLTAELRPVVLDLGAVSAIGQFVEEWADTFAVKAEFHCNGAEDLRLKPEVETHLYRIVQEALNNISKHAGAHHVDVQLSRRDPLLVLRISDDGQGFDLSARAHARADAHSRGLGLVGMRERAQIINGVVDVHSAVGQGTTVTLQVPIATSVRQDPGPAPSE